MQQKHMIGIILNIGQLKAFDMILDEYLLEVFKKDRFGTRFISWNNLLYMKISSTPWNLMVFLQMALYNGAIKGSEISQFRQYSVHIVLLLIEPFCLGVGVQMHEYLSGYHERTGA